MNAAPEATSPIGFGGGRLPGCADQAAATTLLRRAVELGVTLIDTADVYGAGTGEARIARALHPYPPGVTIATKGGFTRGPAGAVPDGRPAHLRAACEASLTRLRVETIDLYQLHAPDPQVPLEESLGALAELRTEGKVRRVGISNVTPGQLARAQVVTEIASVQNGYNVRRRRRFGVDPVVRECERAGIQFMAWQPLAAGRIDDEAIRLIAARHGATPGQVALAWLLHASPAMRPIPGTKSIGHLEENMAAAEVRLDAGDLAALEAKPDAGVG